MNFVEYGTFKIQVKKNQTRKVRKVKITVQFRMQTSKAKFFSELNPAENLHIKLESDHLLESDHFLFKNKKKRNAVNESQVEEENSRAMFS